MTYVFIALISIGYLYIFGIIMHKVKEEPSLSQKEFYKLSLLSLIGSIVLVIGLHLIGMFDNIFTGIMVIALVSFIYRNMFIPIVNGKQLKDHKNKNEIIDQLVISVAFVLLYGILYLIFS